MRLIVDAHAAGRRDEALAMYQRWLPLINHENRQCGLLAAKALMKAGGVINSDAPRRPLPPLHPDARRGLLEIAQGLDPLLLRRGP
jgi:dihydrodipicolinate synthase/N-acetylneuraminate lyase